MHVRLRSKSFAVAVTAFSLGGLLASAAPAEAVTPVGAAAANAMRFGFTVPTEGHESAQQAIDRQVNTYGNGILRLYYPGTPAPWSRINTLSGGLPVSASFKMSPQAVNTGRYDAQMLAWFQSAPKDRNTWWSFHPEPEDDIQWGNYTAADFRSAYARLAGLEHRADNPRLMSTWMIMCYTLRPGSNRDWRNYWPGDSNVDAIGFDCAQKGIKNGTYSSPSLFLDEARDMARSVHKPWGLGEFASQLVPGDNGTRRAAWLTSVAKYLASNGASFAMYYDADRNVNFKLSDKPSRDAWRAVVVDQTP